MSLARELARIVFDAEAKHRINIFLCGGATPGASTLRNQLREVIQYTRSKYDYKCHFPEHLFEDILFGHHKVDLLGLENLLAESAHCVAILLDSPGTIAELGAFANHAQLRHKLIVFSPPRYRHTKSFINLGPIKYLVNNKIGKVIHAPLEPSSRGAIARDIRSFAQSVYRRSPNLRSNDLRNPIFAYEFYLSLIYVFDPIDRNSIIRIATDLSDTTDETTLAIADAAIGTLVRDGLVVRSPDGFSTSQKAEWELFASQSDFAYFDKRLRSIYSALRTRALNIMFRKRRGGTGVLGRLVNSSLE